MHAKLLQMLLLSIAGWFNEYQQAKLEFVLEQLRAAASTINELPLGLPSNTLAPIRRCNWYGSANRVLYQNSLRTIC